jgi:hypothetical protein
MAELGKIGKPEAESYKKKRKIYFLRNLYLPENASNSYISIHDRYWKEAEEHLGRLEAAGKVSRIFCESIYLSGEEAEKVLHSMSSGLEEIVKKKLSEGAELLPLESQEIFEAYIDWYNCLSVTRTPQVHEMIHKHLDDTIAERFEHIRSVIDEGISDGEAALLIMRDEDREFLKIPDDIEFFLITPPAYDDLLKSIRDSVEGKEYWRP